MKPVDRISLFIEHLNITTAEFERKCGLYYGYVANQKRGSGGFSGESLKQIFDVFPELNFDWVITGRGTMLYSDISTYYKDAYDSSIKQITTLYHIIGELEAKKQI
ncbi:hypothetical protein [Petrimonas sulfuriphila]|uniref:hypothetical protein n=1 Tax=Petrimonas sulfuriphila TaxID=285070 RepID=UPI003EBEC08D